MSKIGIFIGALIVGFVLGLIAAIYLFAIDVDVLAIPYVNKGIVTKEDILISQNDILLEIPKGTEMTLVRRTPGAEEYALHFYVHRVDDILVETLPLEPSHFELKKEDAQKTLSQ